MLGYPIYRLRYDISLVGGLEHDFLFFHIYGNNKLPFDETPSFFRGVSSNHQAVRPVPPVSQVCNSWMDFLLGDGPMFYLEPPVNSRTSVRFAVFFLSHGNMDDFIGGHSRN